MAENNFVVRVPVDTERAPTQRYLEQHLLATKSRDELFELVRQHGTLTVLFVDSRTGAQVGRVTYPILARASSSL